jgi:CHASE2 domain-containing sensor protein
MLQLMAEHPFPWSREVWARLLDRLFESGARLVIFDLIFDPPNEGDQIFRARSIVIEIASSLPQISTSKMASSLSCQMPISFRRPPNTMIGLAT